MSDFMEVYRDTARVLKDADPRPGMMTKEQEAAQCRFVSACLDAGIDEYEEDGQVAVVVRVPDKRNTRRTHPEIAYNEWYAPEA